MNPKAAARKQVAKVEEASRLLSDWLQRRYAAATLEGIGEQRLAGAEAGHGRAGVGESVCTALADAGRTAERNRGTFVKSQDMTSYEKTSECAEFFKKIDR